MSSTLNKDDARALIDRLPDNATWDDLMREIYVRQALDVHHAVSEIHKDLV